MYWINNDIFLCVQSLFQLESNNNTLKVPFSMLTNQKLHLVSVLERSFFSILCSLAMYRYTTFKKNLNVGYKNLKIEINNLPNMLN